MALRHLCWRLHFLFLFTPLGGLPLFRLIFSLVFSSPGSQRRHAPLRISAISPHRHDLHLHCDDLHIESANMSTATPTSSRAGRAVPPMLLCRSIPIRSNPGSTAPPRQGSTPVSRYFAARIPVDDLVQDLPDYPQELNALYPVFDPRQDLSRGRRSSVDTQDSNTWFEDVELDDNFNVIRRSRSPPVSTVTTVTEGVVFSVRAIGDDAISSVTSTNDGLSGTTAVEDDAVSLTLSMAISPRNSTAGTVSERFPESDTEFYIETDEDELASVSEAHVAPAASLPVVARKASFPAPVYYVGRKLGFFRPKHNSPQDEINIAAVEERGFFARIVSRKNSTDPRAFARTFQDIVTNGGECEMHRLDAAPANPARAAEGNSSSVWWLSGLLRRAPPSQAPVLATAVPTPVYLRTQRSAGHSVLRRELSGTLETGVYRAKSDGHFDSANISRRFDESPAALAQKKQRDARARPSIWRRRRATTSPSAVPSQGVWPFSRRAAQMTEDQTPRFEFTTSYLQSVSGGASVA